MQIYRYLEVWYDPHVAVFFEASVLRDVHILYSLSLQQRDFCNILNKFYLLVVFFAV